MAEKQDSVHSSIHKEDLAEVDLPTAEQKNIDIVQVRQEDGSFEFDGIHLPEDLVKIAAEEIGETPEVKEQALKDFRALVEEASLKDEHKEDSFDTSTGTLLRYLRTRKFRVEQAFQTYMNFHKFQKQHPEYYENLSGEEFRELYKAGFMRVLRGLDNKGRRVSTLVPRNMGNWIATGNATGLTMMRFSNWAMGRMARDPYMQVLGTVIIEDFTGFAFSDSFKMSSLMPPAMMSNSFHFMQKCAPYRLGGIHVFNEPTFMRWMWALVKPFMSKKLQQRVFLHGSGYEALHELMNPSHLPEEFGGTLNEDPMLWLEEQIALEKIGM